MDIIWYYLLPNKLSRGRPQNGAHSPMMTLIQFFRKEKD